MITDKKNIILKTIALTVLVILSLTLIACSSDGDIDKYDGIFSPDDEPAWNAEHEYATYAVVVSSEASAAVYDAAAEITEGLSENTGAHAERFYAYEEIPSGEDVCQIFIGDVGFEASRRYLKDFRAEDIGYSYHDKCVYIGGITDASLLRAIDRFIDDVVVYADREFFMNDGTDFFLEGEYDVGEIKLCGFPLGEYTIVYPNGNDKLRTIANYFSMKMLISSGYVIPVCTDTDLQAESRVILLGDCDVEAFDEYKIPSDPYRVRIVGFDAGVMLVSEQPSAIKVAIERLEGELLSADEDECVNVTLEDAIDIEFDTTDMSVLSVRAESSDLLQADMISIASRIEESYPDLVRLEAISADSMQLLFYGFLNKYELIELSDNTYHMIRKDRYTYQKESERGVDLLKYKHIEKGTSVTVTECFGEPDEAKPTLISTLGKNGAVLVFSDGSLSDIETLGSAAAIFEQEHIGGIDTAYFAGESLSLLSYSATEEATFNHSYTQIKLISFK